MKNPLTVIAIFAGLAEVAGTAVLPFVADAQQSVYIWFLMVFPALLVVLFFLTLNFNPRVLYAPSDFRDESNYMRIFRPPTAAELDAKAEEEGQLEDETDGAPELDEETEPDVAGAAVDTHEGVTAGRVEGDRRSRVMLAERLVIERLALEFGVPSVREVAVTTSSGPAIFDAFFESSAGGILVEVKHLRDGSSMNSVRRIAQWLKKSLSSLPDSIRKTTRLILVVTYEIDQKAAREYTEKLRTYANALPLPVEVRAYHIDELMNRE